MSSALLATTAMAAGAAEPDQTVAALWNALSNNPGEAADTAALEKLFHNDAVVFGGRYDKGTPRFGRTNAADFIARQGNVSATGFYECEVAREIKRYDRLAVALSIVESRTAKSTPRPDFVGVNSVQLYFDGIEWRIVSLYYHVENPDAPVAYAAPDGGRCLNHY